jgi:ribosomal protein S18 acetylase RimI-like enzyme
VPETIARLRPMTAADIPAVITIGRRIWQEHYVPIIGQEQVDYMTSQRFTADYLSRYLPTAADNVPSAVRWLDMLEQEGEGGTEVVGYCSYALGDKPGELKLEQLYLLPGLHGQGLGGLMLQHIEHHARTLGLSTLWLTVNKNNAISIRIYRKRGFSVRESAIFNIGSGFVMDDYVMVKQLA